MIRQPQPATTLRSLRFFDAFGMKFARVCVNFVNAAIYST
jgi:hypothetical protein